MLLRIRELVVLDRSRWKLACVKACSRLVDALKSAACSVACLTVVLKRARRGRSKRLVSNCKVSDVTMHEAVHHQFFKCSASQLSALRRESCDTVASYRSALLCGVLLHKMSQCGGCQRLWTVA